MARAMTRAAADDGDEAAASSADLTPERFAEMAAAEQFVLTVSERGFGKRSSSYEYRTADAAAKASSPWSSTTATASLNASFPISDNDQIMLVTDGGQLIRCPVHDVRIAGRNTQGVRIFKTDSTEKVVSVERISEDQSGDDSSGSDDGGEPNGDEGGEA